MANLLERSSLVLTPTAYNNGEALCIKPDDGSGDFTFSRNSAATRVNAQGLVENVQILSSNLVQNGDFSEEGVQEVSNGSFTNGSTDWTLGTGWSIGEDKATFDETIGGAGDIVQNSILTSGKSYKLTFDTLETNGGNLAYKLGGGYTFISNIQANTTHTVYGVSGGSQFALRGASDFIGSITNISVKEVGQNWVFGDSWDIGSSKATRATSINWGLDQTISSAVNGRTYRVTTEITDYNSGNLQLALGSGGTVNAIGSALGVYVNEFVWDGTSGTIIRYQGNFIGSITNISIIEITDDTNLPRINYEGFSYQDALGSELVTNGDFDTDSDWIKGTGWSIANGKAIKTSGNSGFLSQNTGLVVGKNYKATFTISNVTNGSLNLMADFSTSVQSFTSDGDYIVYYQPNGANLVFLSNATFNGSIDNVSVKEYSGQEVVPDSGCGSWLFEPQSTNLITQSELFSDASWVKSNTTVTPNTETSPDGTQNADTINGFSVNNDKIQVITGINSANNTYTFSVWLSGVGTINIGLSNNVDDAINNQITLTSVLTRYTITKTFNATAGNLIGRIIFVTGDTATSCVAWGAQLEQQSYATSYIPTSGSTNTRNQDLCYNGATGTGLINSTEGVLYAEIAALADDLTNRFIILNDGTSNNRLTFRYLAASNRLSMEVHIGGVLKITIHTTFADITVTQKVALKYKESDYAFWVNGVEVGTNTLAEIWSANTLNNIDFDGFGQPFFGKTKALAVWKEALTDAELTSLTTI